MAWALAAIFGLMTIGVISAHYLGADNEVEEVAEETAEFIEEKELHMTEEEAKALNKKVFPQKKSS